ncbi:hypothetical protein OIU35_31785 [Boseaceae bacterium BT-24-1]|nr:hypothetical protein [Boseaceae bacterium BT-24-1]
MATTFITQDIPGVGRLYSPVTVRTVAEVAETARLDRERVQRNSAAIAAALAAVERSAVRTMISVTKTRARAYLQHPGKLNAIRWNLSQVEPAEGLRIVERLYRDEPRSGGIIDIPLTNLAAARIAFRWARRHERAADRAAMLAAE